MNIVICDDEENVRIYIRKLIERQDIGCWITEFTSGRELLQFWNKENGEEVDILFLDISMKDMDGIAVAKQLRNRMEERQKAVWGSLPLLIFVTGHSQYMSEAFSVNAFQYIVKPIGENDFKRVFAQAVREYSRLTDDRPVKRMEESKVFLIRNGNTTRNIFADDIYYIESSNRKVILHMENEKIEYYGKIGELETELGTIFFRIHKGYLINMKYAEQYDRTEVRMKNGDSLPVSKYKYQDFVKAYLGYISEER